MSDMGETFQAMREASMEKRKASRAHSAAMLYESGIRFDARNHGAHLIVTHNGKTVDFWPGTGKYIDRNTNRKGRGVRNLIKHLES